MRLICPNCGAQYAVDDRVIPDAGRDVQCSNCGHTWFQRHPNHDTELAEELSWSPPGSAPPPRPVPQFKRHPRPEPAPEPETGIAGESAAEPAPEAASAEPEPAGAGAGLPEEAAAAEALADETGAPDAATATGPEPGPDDDTAPEPVEVAGPPRPRVDEDTLSVLREEAEREHAARRAESGSTEYQPDLGVPSPEASRHRGTADYARTTPYRESQDETRPSTPRPPSVRPMGVSQRRANLPDVEQITSTLEPSDSELSERGEDDRAARRRRSGMRVGLGLAFLAFGLATLVYTRSERIVAAVPETAEPLGSYVANVDAGRLWLDRTLRGLVSSETAGEDG